MYGFLSRQPKNYSSSSIRDYFSRETPWKFCPYCILITTRNAKSHSVTSKTLNAYRKKNVFLLAVNRTSKILLVRCGICIVMSDPLAGRYKQVAKIDTKSNSSQTPESFLSHMIFGRKDLSFLMENNSFLIGAF